MMVKNEEQAGVREGGGWPVVKQAWPWAGGGRKGTVGADLPSPSSLSSSLSSFSVYLHVSSLFLLLSPIPIPYK